MCQKAICLLCVSKSTRNHTTTPIFAMFAIYTLQAVSACVAKNMYEEVYNTAWNQTLNVAPFCVNICNSLFADTEGRCYPVTPTVMGSAQNLNIATPYGNCAYVSSDVM